MVNIIVADVLVVGGGASGSRAAIEADLAGAKVILAVKGEFGLVGVRGAGATGSGSPRYLHLFNSYADHASHVAEMESYYNRTIRAGLGLADRKLAKTMTAGALDARETLKNWGLIMGPGNPKNPGAIESNILPMPGMANVIRATPSITVKQHTMVVDLLVDNNVCKGAVAVDELTGETSIIQAGAVIIATGGNAQMYQLSFHPPCVTGDGVAMGYASGAEFMNMEFTQMFIVTAYPTVTMVPYHIWGLFPKVLNANRRQFIRSYLPDDVSLEEAMKAKVLHGPYSTRDASKYIEIAMVKETKAGKANGHSAFYLEVPGALRKDPEMLFPEYGDWYAYRGIDFNQDYIEVNVAHHCSNGGYRIDENGRTTVQGLYAVGETATGAYGADRLGGAMMTSCQVFGSRAGRDAAACARAARPGNVRKLAASNIETIEKLKANGGTKKPAALIAALKKSTSDNLLAVRTGEGLDGHLHRIRKIRKDMVGVAVSSSADLIAALELRNMLTTGEMVTSAALMRTESRGSHYREEYPERDDTNWLQAIVIKNDSGKMRFATRKIDEKWSKDDADLGWWG